MVSVVHGMLQSVDESQAGPGLITSADDHDARNLFGYPLVPFAGLNGLRMLSGSELRRSLEVAAREEMRHRALVASLREPVITTSLDARITGFNAAAVALLGEPAVLYRQSIHTILPFVEAPQACADLNGLWQGHITTFDG
jgi:PAS domain-containing protein